MSDGAGRVEARTTYMRREGERKKDGQRERERERERQQATHISCCAAAAVRKHTRVSRRWMGREGRKEGRKKGFGLGADSDFDLEDCPKERERKPSASKHEPK